MNPNPQSTSSNFHQTELDKFAALANRWWDVDGPQKPLHALNPVRLDYVAARVALPGARVLDVGCGGGLLSEAMARLGAQVTAIDLAPELVKVARCTAWNRACRWTTACSRWKTWLPSSRAASMR